MNLEKTGDIHVFNNNSSRKLSVMKFHSISAMMIIIIINYSVVMALWPGSRITGNAFNWVVKIIGIKSNMCEMTHNGYLTRCSHCTGSIISAWHILTAAHCFRDIKPVNDVSVAAGRICVNDRCTSTRYRVEEIHIHPNYGFNTINIPGRGNMQLEFKTNDVAVLTLKTQLPFGETIAAIPLPATEPNWFEENSACRVAGWAENPIDASVEHLLWTSIGIESSIENGFMECRYNGFICGRNPHNSSILTGGDSGGGLMCEGVVAGIAIQAPFALNGAPMIFETVYYFLPFINSILKKDAEFRKSYMPKPRKQRECICL